jgi:1-acyl-sn-glycerol-3-phosphate acyltransferase
MTEQHFVVTRYTPSLQQQQRFVSLFTFQNSQKKCTFALQKFNMSEIQKEKNEITPPVPAKKRNLAFERLALFSPEKNKWIVSIIVILTIVFLFFSFDTSFETNMHAINYMTPEQRQQFEKLLKEQDINKKTIYCVAEGKNIDDALSNYEKTIHYLDNLLKDSLITQKIGIGIYLPSQEMQQYKVDLWNNFWKDRRTSLIENLEKAAQNQGYNANAFDVFKFVLAKNYEVQPLEYFSIIQNNLGESYLSITPEKSMIYTFLQLNKEHQQAVEKKLNTIDEQVFVFDNTSITEKMVNALSEDFDYVLYICGFIVFFFLLFSFGRIELTLMAFIPLTIAWVWILGMMSIFGMKFNIVSIILAAFIFGQGDDYTIFVTEGLLHEYTYRKKMLALFKNTLVLSAVIMFLAIGMLIFAKHPAMRSLAEVTIVGMISVLMMAYIFPPLIFNALTMKKGKHRLMPITLWNFTKTTISFIVFLVGSIILTITGFHLLTIGGKTKKHKYKYHQILCVTFRILAKMMIQVPFKVLNPHKENFEKSGIIIANHQSHIDMMYILMLSPKIITLTNEWVWKSPFYGWIIRYADFLPIIDGIENHVDKLGKLIKDGYSILIFPEGTRSEDCGIGRFKKGAFYLADILKVDIIPLVIHGIGHVLPKIEFMLRKGLVHIEIGERISPDHPMRKNKEVLEISKTMRNLHKKRYENLANQIETADYFRDKVYHNYIYKGPMIERRARKNLKTHKNYHSLISNLPDKGKVLITNCGQGEFPLMCALVKKNLLITATEQNKELFTIAKNCIFIPQNLFYEENVINFEEFDYVLNFNLAH